MKKGLLGSTAIVAATALTAGMAQAAEAPTMKLSGFMNLAAGDLGSFPDDLPKHAGTAVAKDWVRPNKRIFDNKRISDHFAIIPTGQIPANLYEAEQKLYDIVARRVIASFYPQSASENPLTPAPEERSPLK